MRKLKPDAQGPILCFVGPPGRRQDLARAARSRGRWAASSSASALGGVHDEAEIRGHRRTYVGAMPGQIIQGAARGRAPRTRSSCSTRSTSSGADFRGDPSAALLEVLDPGAERHVPRPLPRRAVRPVEGDVHRHGEHARHDPRPAARPHGGDRARRLHRGGEARRSPSATSCPAARATTASTTSRSQFSDAALRAIISELHARGGRAQPRARDRRRSAARSRREGRRGRRRSAMRRSTDAQVRELARRRRVHRARCAERTGVPGVATGPGLDAGRAATSCSSRRPRCPARAS